MEHVHKRVVRRLGGLLLALAALIGFSTVTAGPAQASPVGAYLVVNNGRCVGGGNVVHITGAVDWMWSGGDSGDNIIWATVDTRRWNTFNGRALCNRPWYRGGQYWINVPNWQFYPSYHGQTFYY